MKKHVKVLALANGKETIFVENDGSIYSATEKQAEFVASLSEVPRKNVFSFAMGQLSKKGYKVAQTFSKEVYRNFMECRKIHLREKMIARDFLEWNFID